MGIQNTGENFTIGLINKIINASNPQAANADVSTSNLQSLFNYSPATNTTLVKMKVNSIWNDLPRFVVTKYPTGVNQDVVVSFPTFWKMLKTLQANLQSDQQLSVYKSFLDVPLDYFLLNLREGLTNKEKDLLINDLKNSLASVGVVASVYDYRVFKAPLENTANTLNFLFMVCTGLAMFICFFSLTSSMYMNILEQRKEIGIFLAMGMKKIDVKRLYVHEAFTLVFSASFLGIVIGEKNLY